MPLLAYCFRCKTQETLIDAEPLTRPRRALQLRARCARCGGAVVRFVPEGFDVRQVPRAPDFGVPHGSLAAR